MSRTMEKITSRIQSMITAEYPLAPFFLILFSPEMVQASALEIQAEMQIGCERADLSQVEYTQKIIKKKKGGLGGHGWTFRLSSTCTSVSQIARVHRGYSLNAIYHIWCKVFPRPASKSKHHNRDNKVQSTTTTRTSSNLYMSHQKNFIVSRTWKTRLTNQTHSIYIYIYINIWQLRNILYHIALRGSPRQKQYLSMKRWNWSLI